MKGEDKMNKIVAGGLGLLAMAVLPFASNMSLPTASEIQPNSSKSLHWADKKNSSPSNDDFERQWEALGKELDAHEKKVREGVAANQAKAAQISKEMDEHIAEHEANRKEYTFADFSDVGKDLPMQPPTQKKQE